MRFIPYLFLLFSIISFGQNKEIKIKANVLTLPLLITNLAVEYPITKKITLEANGIISPWKSFKNNNLQIYMANLDGRYYFDEAFKNFYIGPSIGFAFFNLQKWNYWNTDKYQKGVTFLLGATIGYQFQLNEKFGLDFYISGGNSQGNYVGYSKIDDSEIRYDNATDFNKSGEWLIYKGGVMLTYQL